MTSRSFRSMTAQPCGETGTLDSMVTIPATLAPSAGERATSHKTTIRANMSDSKYQLQRELNDPWIGSRAFAIKAAGGGCDGSESGGVTPGRGRRREVWGVSGI